MISTLATKFLNACKTSGVSKVFLYSGKDSMSFLRPFSFMLISDRQYAVFLISRMFKEFDSLSHSFMIRLSEYLSFYIRGKTFSMNTMKVFSLAAIPMLSGSENLLRASGMMLNRYLGSFLFTSLKNCFTRLSIYGSSSWKSLAM